MFRKRLKLSIVVVLIAAYMMLLLGDGFAAAPAVKLIVNPDTPEVYAGSEPVALTAEASGSGLTFKWELQGPGKIEGEGSEISYIVPKTIKGASAQATIIVAVKDEAGQETTETFMFNILTTKTPAPAKKGMSTGKKVVIGVGAAALLGGGIALAAGGGNDGDGNGPFAGTFTLEFVDQFNDGTPAYWTDTFTLEQKKNETSITGTHVLTLSDKFCCTASFSVSVSGTALSDTSAVLSWGPGRARCEGEGFGGCWIEVWTDGGTFNFFLVDNGNILRSGSDFIRMSVVGSPETRTEVKDDGVLHFGGRDFIRQ